MEETEKEQNYYRTCSGKVPLAATTLEEKEEQQETKSRSRFATSHDSFDYMRIQDCHWLEEDPDLEPMTQPTVNLLRLGRRAAAELESPKKTGATQHGTCVLSFLTNNNNCPYHSNKACQSYP